MNVAKNPFNFRKKYSSTTNHQNSNKFENKNNLVIDLSCEEANKNNKFTFGRRKECNFSRNDKHMSGMHCKIIFVNDCFYLEDYGSTNGTWVRLSMPKTPSVETPVQDGTIVKIGTTITYICRINSHSQENSHPGNGYSYTSEMIDESEEHQLLPLMKKRSSNGTKKIKDEGICEKCEK